MSGLGTWGPVHLPEWEARAIRATEDRIIDTAIMMARMNGWPIYDDTKIVFVPEQPDWVGGPKPDHLAPGAVIVDSTRLWQFVSPRGLAVFIGYSHALNTFYIRSKGEVVQCV